MAGRAVITAVVTAGLGGCGWLEGLFASGEKGAETPAPTEESAADATPETEASTSVAVDPSQAGGWRVFLVFTLEGGEAFTAPEESLKKALAGTDIAFARVSSAEPFVVTGPDGQALGTVDIRQVTDQKQGYIFAQQGRPADFLAPAALPFLLQQASAYYGQEIRIGKGRLAVDGKGVKVKSQLGKDGKGRVMPMGRGPLQMRGKGPPGARKVGKGTEAATGGAEQAAPVEDGN